MSSNDRTVKCAEHGETQATFVCHHLLQGEGAGFYHGFDEENPDELYPNAWCDSCEKRRVAAGGWNDESEPFADVRLLCSHCYMKARRLNWPKSTHAETADLVERASEYLQKRQDQMIEEFDIGSYERYDWDQDTATLVFSNQGKVGVEADFQFVGSYSARSKTWMWSWANESMQEPVCTEVRAVRDYGEQYRLLKLACGTWPADEDEGWDMTAVTARILGALGAYRSPNETGATYMVMTDIRRVD